MIASRSVVLAALVFAAAQLSAQGQPTQSPQPAQRPVAIPKAAPSTRATVAVLIDRRWLEGSWATASVAGPAKIVIDYGQPHLRGRNVIGMPGVVPWDSVWRTGANMSTELTAEVDMTLGNTFLPRGIYTLFSLPTRNGWKLIVSKQLLQWGTDYDPAQDFARIDLKSRTLAEPLESLTFWLVPAIESAQSTSLPHGVLKFAWGNTELSTDWRVGR
ncbi:MAG: hypothetical protein PVSMB1_12280 [Gemmatimonadaceae bacterium]